MGLGDYDNTVTIDNGQLSSYDTIVTGDECGTNRCARCVLSVTPCSDPTTIINWVYTPQAGVDYSIGEIFSGSNINGYVTQTGYEVTGHCLTIIDSTLSTEGTMYTVTDVAISNPWYGTYVSTTTCNSLDCCDCRQNVRVRNSYADGTTSITYTWINCDGSAGLYVLNSNSGTSTLYTIPQCIEYATLSRSPNNGFGGVTNTGTCCY